MKQQDYGHIDVATLSDPDLIAATSLWRTRASRGEAAAHHIVRQHEDEMKRRFGGATTMPATFDAQTRHAGKPWWKRW